MARTTCDVQREQGAELQTSCLARRQIELFFMYANMVVAARVFVKVWPEETTVRGRGKPSYNGERFGEAGMRGFGEQNSKSLQILFDRLISMGKKLEGIYSTPIVELFSLNLLQYFSITSKPNKALLSRSR